MNEKVKFTDQELLAFFYGIVGLVPRNNQKAMEDFIELIEKFLELRFSHDQEFINPSDEQ